MENTQEYKGYTIKIEQDELAESPREWDNLGTMVCWHKRYNLGDSNTLENTHTLPEGVDPEKTYVLPLYLYDHSGITISTKPFNDKFDSGQVGYIYCSVEKAKTVFSKYKDWKRLKAQVYKVLENEVKTYDTYLRGEIYWFRIENSEGEEIDSCGGFYDEASLLEHAKNSIDCMITNAPKARDKSILGRMHI